MISTFPLGWTWVYEVEPNKMIGVFTFFGLVQFFKFLLTILMLSRVGRISVNRTSTSPLLKSAFMAATSFSCHGPFKAFRSSASFWSRYWSGFCANTGAWARCLAIIESRLIVFRINYPVRRPGNCKTSCTVRNRASCPTKSVHRVVNLT